MTSNVFLITGATDGIGRITACELAKLDKNATVLIHGRNPAKLERATEEIKRRSGNPKIEFFAADFSSLEEVRSVAKEILTKHNSINVLINNAGAGFAAPRYGKDRTETRLTVNYLAPFLFTHLLLPAIRKAAPARIVNVASAGQSPIQFDDIMLEKNFDGITAYTQSKLALIMFTIDLASQLQPENIQVNCLHPGTYLDTAMVREAGIQPMGTAQSGADALVYFSTSPDLKNRTGKYYNVKKESRAIAQAYDSDARKKLNAIGLKLTGLERN
jgi:NAD(P)-dependent dehydrogenase (short-subunit alcohol dehydrogenase family)